jgi:hypothetical protein
MRVGRAERSMHLRTHLGSRPKRLILYCNHALRIEGPSHGTQLCCRAEIQASRQQTFAYDEILRDLMPASEHRSVKKISSSFGKKILTLGLEHVVCSELSCERNAGRAYNR